VQVNRAGESCELPIEVSTQLLNDFPIPRLVIINLIVIEIVVQPPEKILLRLTRNRNLAYAFVGGGNVDESDFGIE
jgi:hypothetical protein